MVKFILLIGFIIIALSFTWIAHAQVSDIDGNVYKTVKIGTQTWMAENLKTTKLNDGTSISLVTDSIAWSSLTTPGYCWYNNNETLYRAIYGALYNWYSVNTGKLCPTGWHVPTFNMPMDAEWLTLIKNLGMMSAGDKMIDTSTEYWKSSNTKATNESGFTALPGGFRGNSNWHATSDINILKFSSVREQAFWWSSTELKSHSAWFWIMFIADNTSSISFYSGNKKLGLSVRCIKD